MDRFRVQIQDVEETVAQGIQRDTQSAAGGAGYSGGQIDRDDDLEIAQAVGDHGQGVEDDLVARCRGHHGSEPHDQGYGAGGGDGLDGAALGRGHFGVQTVPEEDVSREDGDERSDIDGQTHQVEKDDEEDGGGQRQENIHFLKVI